MRSGAVAGSADCWADERRAATIVSLERAVRLLAGALVVASVLLTLLVSPWWLLLTTFVGVNLVQSSLTGFCPAERAMSRFLGAHAEQSTCGRRSPPQRG